MFYHFCLIFLLLNENLSEKGKKILRESQLFGQVTRSIREYWTTRVNFTTKFPSEGDSSGCLILATQTHFSIFFFFCCQIFFSSCISFLFRPLHFIYIPFSLLKSVRIIWSTQDLISYVCPDSAFTLVSWASSFSFVIFDYLLIRCKVLYWYF